MSDYDLLVRGAHPWPAIGIADGIIAGLAPGSAREEVDATGLLVLPGVIDAHVHFNEPGRTEWEGWTTGSRAAAAGGITTVCDMPLNSSPPVVTADAFAAKRAAAEAQSIGDVALWGGLVPGHVGDLDALAECGAIGFKAFMAHSGIDDFPKVDHATLRAGMVRAAALGLPVAVHAELDAGDAFARPDAEPRFPRVEPASPSVRGDTASAGAPFAAPAPGTGTVAEYLASRPIASECDAIRIAIELAGETGCALHVVHVSSGRGVSLIAEARARGIDVTAETCPHYLVFTGADMERLGAVAKCAPPMRDEAERAALLAHVRAGRVDTIGSDHSPSPWSMKTDADFFRVWGGIAGIQHLLPILFDIGLDADLIARLTASQVATRFRLRGKGRIEVGYDADLAFVELHPALWGATRAVRTATSDAGFARAGGPAGLVPETAGLDSGFEVTAASLFSRHRLSPYVGRRLRARVRRTMVRGRTVFCDDRIVASGGGRLLTPASLPR